MDKITVVTAVLPAKAHYLGETAESVLSQKLPVGWELEWLLLFDGADTLEAADLLMKNDVQDKRVRFGATSDIMGAAVLRNLMAANASGSLIRNLDHDDLLTEGALARDIECMQQHPEIAFCASATTNLEMPARTLDGWLDPAEGPLPVGQIAQWWTEREWVEPIHPSAVCSRIQHLQAIGGWMALQPMTEDVGLLIAMNCLWPGWFLSEISLHYRIWPEQTSDSMTDEDPVRIYSCVAVDKRIAALRAVFNPDWQAVPGREK